MSNTVNVHEIEFFLLGWGTTHNGGSKVTFEVSDEDLDWFKRMTTAKGKVAGQRLKGYLVEVGPDEQPIDTAKEAPPAKAASKSKFPDGLKGLSVRWCLDPHFQRWTVAEFGNEEEPSEAFAKSAILALCGIASRSALDTDADAIAAFEEFVRKPYAEQRQKDGLDDGK